MPWATPPPYRILLASVLRPYMYMCTEQQKYISALSKLQERADLSDVWYTNMKGIVVFQKVVIAEKLDIFSCFMRIKEGLSYVSAILKKGQKNGKVTSIIRLLFIR